MFINAIGYYIPEKRVDNHYFSKITGLSDDWIIQRTGIRTRSRARDDENVNTMCLEAVKNAISNLPYDIHDVDLIIASTYSPYDTVGTAAHVVQHEFGIENMRAFTLSAACTSFINSLEIVDSYFATGKAKKALIIGGDKNSTYSNIDDPKAGHLWGDAAVACFLSSERYSDEEAEIIDIDALALGHIGKGPEGIQLRPKDGGIRMPEGKDVFIQACLYMPKCAMTVLERNGYATHDIDYFIGHQANMRILNNVAKTLSLSDEKVLTNIEELGNTGSASCALVYAQNEHRFKKDDLICISVFGGGYSAGACLIRY